MLVLAALMLAVMVTLVVVAVRRAAAPSSIGQCDLPFGSGFTRSQRNSNAGPENGFWRPFALGALPFEPSGREFQPHADTF
jgi:hypothetical protein